MNRIHSIALLLFALLLAHAPDLRAVLPVETQFTLAAGGSPATSVNVYGTAAEDAMEQGVEMFFDPCLEFDKARSVQALLIGALTGGPKGVCFAAGTLVQTEDGLRPIEEVKAGERVWAWDERTGEVALRVVERAFVRQAEALVEVEAGGGRVQTTAEHPFWVEGLGWVNAGQLQPGDAIKTLSGECQTVTGVARQAGRVTVYNFEVEGFHTYFVSGSGLLVHNARCHGHHSDPKFMGGDPNQKLTKMPPSKHRELHKDLNDHLRNQTDKHGNHMRPQRNNSKERIQDNFSRADRLDAMADFYQQNRGAYPDAARDFFNQHPNL